MQPAFDPADLPELLLAGLDWSQAAGLTGLPALLCRGCSDVLHGEAAPAAPAPLYVSGQRLADNFIMAGLDPADVPA